MKKESKVLVGTSCSVNTNLVHKQCSTIRLFAVLLPHFVVVTVAV